jgi:hypothetical protein
MGTFNDYIQTPHIPGDLSDNNPMCDSESQGKLSFDQKSRNKAMHESKSFNNLSKTSQLHLAFEQREIQPSRFNNKSLLQGHLNDFKKNKRSSTTKGYEITKNSNNLYNSSIHQCKPICCHPNQNGNFNMHKEIDNYITNGSISSSERIDDRGCLAFGTHSNISDVPRHHDEDYVYSSVDGMTADILNHKNNPRESMSKFENKQNRYNESFGPKYLQVDTSPNAIMMNDFYEGRMTTNHKEYQKNSLKHTRNLNGSRSTKSITSASFMNPKKTVSINLYANDVNSGGSNSSSDNARKELTHIDQNISQFSTLRKSGQYTQMKKTSKVNSALKDHLSKLGNRKRTHEDLSPLVNLTRQLERTEKDLASVSKKQSQQIGSIHDKIRTLKTQLNQHRVG